MSCGAAFAQGEEALKAGRALFTQGAQPACSVCHALKDAGAAGAIGPDLDQLKPDAARVEQALRQGIGVMPAYEETLSDEQIDALARYVAAASNSTAR